MVDTGLVLFMGEGKQYRCSNEKGFKHDESEKFIVGILFF